MTAYTYCPECRKKGITFRYKITEGHNESNYCCRYCQWYFFTDGYLDENDRRKRDQWREINPIT